MHITPHVGGRTDGMDSRLHKKLIRKIYDGVQVCRARNVLIVIYNTTLFDGMQA